MSLLKGGKFPVGYCLSAQRRKDIFVLISILWNGVGEESLEIPHGATIDRSLVFTSHFCFPSHLLPPGQGGDGDEEREGESTKRRGGGGIAEET